MQLTLSRIRDDVQRLPSDARRQLAEARRQQDRLIRGPERAKQTSPIPDEDAEKNAEELGDALADLKIPDLDIVICLDVSGSMEDEIEGLKREITDLANVLDTLAPSTGIGAVAFGDRRWRTPVHVQQIAGVSRLSIIEQFVGRLEPNMRDPRWRRNEDYPEALATALDHAAGLNWRSISRRRYIVVISDAAVYPDREQSALRTAQSFASVPGQTVSSVWVLDLRTNPERFMRALAAAGNRSFIEAMHGETMLAILKSWARAGLDECLARTSVVAGTVGGIESGRDRYYGSVAGWSVSGIQRIPLEPDI